MDLGPVDARWMPFLPLRERWVLIGEAGPAAEPGVPVLLAHGELGAPVLAGVEVMSTQWRGRDLSGIGPGTACKGQITAVYEAAFVQWSPEATPWTATCTDANVCPGAVAEAAWRDGRHLLVGRTTGMCAEASWARVGGTNLAGVAAEAADEPLLDLAIARFRQLPAWTGIEARWIEEAQPLDSTEWDTAGGANPEVSRFTLAGATYVTVVANAGSTCGASFSASFAVAWRANLETTTLLTQIVQDWAPDFAPEFAVSGTNGPAFLAPGRVAEPRRPALDARPTQLPGCPVALPTDDER